MENIVVVSSSWEKVEVGYVSTFVRMNRATNEILSVSYHWDADYNVRGSKVFKSFESLKAFINKLIDAKNESELNALESQTDE